MQILNNLSILKKLKKFKYFSIISNNEFILINKILWFIKFKI